MKLLRVAICTAISLSAASLVQAGDKPQTIQQPQMIECNQQAGERTGEDRQNFMAECLQNQNAAAEPAADSNASQDKIASCNQQAEGRHGKDRKAFLKACLK